MIEVILKARKRSTVDVGNVSEGEPIFAKKRNKLVGMLIKEEKGWIIRIGGRCGASGWHASRIKCLESCVRWGYTFFIEEED